MAQSNRWVFTLNNPTQEERTLLEQNLGDGEICKYGIFGEETGQSGTFHLQGFVIFVSRRRLRSAREAISTRAHLEVARGTSEQAREYCKKDGDFYEFGEFPESQQGRRNDLESIVAWADSWVAEHGRPPSKREFAVHQPVAYIKYPRMLQLCSERYPSPQFFDGEQQLRDWQRRLMQRIEEPPSNREVVFVIDEDGNKGKSWFQRYCLQNLEGVQLFTVGKKEDIAYAIDESVRFLFFNVPRGAMEYISYPLLEQIKDRVVFSPKYESRVKLLHNDVWLIVFCNEQPDREKMTSDRYCLINIH